MACEPGTVPKLPGTLLSSFESSFESSLQEPHYGVSENGDP